MNTGAEKHNGELLLGNAGTKEFYTTRNDDTNDMY